MQEKTGRRVVLEEGGLRAEHEVLEDAARDEKEHDTSLEEVRQDVEDGDEAVGGVDHGAHLGLQNVLAGWMGGGRGEGGNSRSRRQSDKSHASAGRKKTRRGEPKA